MLFTYKTTRRFNVLDDIGLQQKLVHKYALEKGYYITEDILFELLEFMETKNPLCFIHQTTSDKMFVKDDYSRILEFGEEIECDAI